jgi:endogenous inhibitor of DNA gyrase (YacG/DUF329 family)
MRLETLHPSKDHEAKCPTCGGGVHRRLFGEMYAGSFVLDGERVEIRRVPDPGYRDPIYLDEITQYFDGGLYRLWPSEVYLSRGGKRIHRDAWVAAFGPIPKGCHIHHRDGNVLNNSLDNLECMPAGTHLSVSRAQREQPADGWFSADARQKAADWHSSPEGKLWHKRHAKRSKSWTKWKREEKPCEQCGKPHMALVRKSGNAGKYCSQACKVAAYRERGKANDYAAAYRARQKVKRNG